MRRAIEIQLDEARRRQLERVSRSPSASVRLVERVQIVLLAAAGAENVDIASCLDISRQKAGRWRDRFAACGLAGIEKDAPRSGRLPSISKRKRASIVRKTTTETPAHATHWSLASMAAATGVSASTIGRIWRSYGLKPHLSTTFKLSNDRRFAEKLEDVVGLYLNPPDHAVVLSCDEKSQMQALDRTQPGLPIKKGRGGTMTHDYKRNGTTSLFAALNVLEGTVIGTCMEKHRHQEWLRFLNLIKRSVPEDQDIHLICDNYATHKTREGEGLVRAEPTLSLPLHAHQCVLAEHGGTLLSGPLRTPTETRGVWIGDGVTAGRGGLYCLQQSASESLHLDGSSQRSVQFWSVSMANKSSIVSDLHGWRTPSVSGEELQAPGKSGPQ